MKASATSTPRSASATTLQEATRVTGDATSDITEQRGSRSGAGSAARDRSGRPLLPAPNSGKATSVLNHSAAGAVSIGGAPADEPPAGSTA